MLLWIARNICGILLVTTAGCCSSTTSPARPRPRLWEGSTLEFVAACLTSVRCTSSSSSSTPFLLFLVLGVLIWCGVRFGTLMNSCTCSCWGTSPCWATLEGSGPFTESDPMVNALLVQFFVVATASVGLALSTGLDERAALHARAGRGPREMTDQAQLLNAVVNSMAEGLAVVDDAGRWLLRNPAATRSAAWPVTCAHCCPRRPAPATRWRWRSRADRARPRAGRVRAAGRGGSWPSPRRRCPATARPAGPAPC
jgi:PAS domain-containing protein